MKNILLVLFAVATSIVIKAQTPADLRLNEIAVVRDSSGAVTDAWIEIYNSSTSRVDMQRLFISDDRNNLRKCHVPANHSETQFPARGFVVFDGDGDRSQGALHTNFKLGESQWLYLVESNGYIIIDSAAVPREGVVARDVDGIGEWKTIEAGSKGLSNAGDEGIANSETFTTVDPYGAGVALISMSVVFSVLIVLSITFTLLGKFFKRKEKIPEPAATTAPAAANSNDDELAAVAVAVTLYLNDAHDDGDRRLTIIRTSSVAWKHAAV